jgi:hypothetical protein
VSESPIQGADLHRHRALELILLAGKTDDLDAAAEMLELAGKQLELAIREDAPQHQKETQRTTR